MKIADFGLAKLLAAEANVTATGEALGTPSYMAPEQARGSFSERTDIYALGAILYELLAGRPPFSGETPAETLVQVQTREPIAPRAIRPAIHADLEAICLRCLEKESSRRYATAAELAEDLHRFLAGKPTVARPLSRVRRGLRWAQREPVVAGLVSAAALLLATIAVGGVTVAVRLDRSRREAESNFARAEASAPKLRNCCTPVAFATRQRRSRTVTTAMRVISWQRLAAKTGNFAALNGITCRTRPPIFGRQCPL